MYCILSCSKNVRNKFQPSERKAIMLGYSQERKAYRLFDIERKSVIEERNLNFDKIQKDSCFLEKDTKNVNYDWNIHDLINNDNDARKEVSPNVEQGNNKHNESESDEKTEDIEDRIDNQYVEEQLKLREIVKWRDQKVSQEQRI